MAVHAGIDQSHGKEQRDLTSTSRLGNSGKAEDLVDGAGNIASNNMVVTKGNISWNSRLAESRLNEDVKGKLKQAFQGPLPKIPEFNKNVLNPFARIVFGKQAIFLANASIEESLKNDQKTVKVALNENINTFNEIKDDMREEAEAQYLGPPLQHLSNDEAKLTAIFSLNSKAIANKGEKDLEEKLEENGAVVPIGPKLERSDVAHYQYPIYEHEKDYARVFVDAGIVELFQEMDARLNNKENILLYCNQGEHRSAAVLVLYLATRLDMPFEKVHAYVSAYREIKSYNTGRATLMTQAYTTYRAIQDSKVDQT